LSYPSEDAVLLVRQGARRPV